MQDKKDQQKFYDIPFKRAWLCGLPPEAVPHVDLLWLAACCQRENTVAYFNCHLQVKDPAATIWYFYELKIYSSFFLQKERIYSIVLSGYNICQFYLVNYILS